MMETHSHPVASTAIVASRLGPLRVWFGMLLKPRATLERMSRARRISAWLPAVLMSAVVFLATYAHSYAYGHYLYTDQMAYYTQHPEYATFAPPLTTTLTVKVSAGPDDISRPSVPVGGGEKEGEQHTVPTFWQRAVQVLKGFLGFGS